MKIKIGIVSIVMLSVMLKSAPVVSAIEPTAGQVFGYANALCENECFPEAVRQYLKVANDYPGNENIKEAEYMIGECLQREKKYWRAIEHWQDLIKKYPGTEWAKKAEKGIRMIKIVTENSDKLYCESSPKIRAADRYSVTMEDRIAEAYCRNGVEHLVRAAMQTDYGTVFEKREFDRAVYWFDKVLAEYPDTAVSPYAIDQTGTLYWSKQNTEGWNAAVEQCLKIGEKYPADYSWLMRALRWASVIYTDQIKDDGKAKLTLQKLIDRANKELGDDSYYKAYGEVEMAILK